MHCIALHCIALHCIALHYITLHYIHTCIHAYMHTCIASHHIRSHHITLHYIHTLHTLHDMTLHYIHTLHTLHDMTLHYMTLHYSTLQYITLHYHTYIHYIKYMTWHDITLHYIHTYIYIHMSENEGYPKIGNFMGNMVIICDNRWWGIGSGPLLDKAIPCPRVRWANPYRCLYLARNIFLRYFFLPWYSPSRQLMAIAVLRNNHLFLMKP